MAKSFLKSLPSHRRKHRHHRSRGGGGGGGDGSHRQQHHSGPTPDLPSPEHSKIPSQLSQESMVEATQVPFPPPMRGRAWAERYIEEEEEEEEEEEGKGEAAAEDGAENKIDSHHHDHGRHGKEEGPSPSQRSVVEATEVQFPPPGRAERAATGEEAREARRVSADPGGEQGRARPEAEVHASPVQSSLPIKTEQADDDVFDEETVLESPVEGRGGRGAAASQDGRGETEALGLGATKPPHREPEERAAAQEEKEKPQDDIATGMDREESRDVEGDNASRGRSGPERERALETDPYTNTRRGAETSMAEETLRMRAREEGRSINDEGKRPPEPGPLGSGGAEASRGEQPKESHTDTGRNPSLDTAPVNLDARTGEQRIDREVAMETNAASLVNASGAANRPDPGHDEAVDAPEGARNRGGTKTEGDELELSTADIRGCIVATRVAKEIMEADSSLDPFDGIDVERWLSIFGDFEGYLTALGDETSTEAKELTKISSLDRVFAIFDEGMDVNHCNAVFIYGMIRTMVGGLEAYGKGHSQGVPNRPSRREAFDGCKKLHHLASCLDLIFGVTEESETCPMAVSVRRAEGDNATVLKFSLEPEEEGKTSAARVAAPSAALSPHLQAMDQVFAQFAEKETRPLQSQLDAAQNTLAATREGAMALQRRALKVQDDLHAAQAVADEAKSRQERAKAELERQEDEFEKKEELFERAKERLKAEIRSKEAELAEAKRRHQFELAEAKAKLERAKQRCDEQRSELKEARSTGRKSTEARSTGRKSVEYRSTGYKSSEHRDTGRRSTEHRDTGRRSTERRDTGRRSMDRSRDTERRSTDRRSRDTERRGTEKRKRQSEHEPEHHRSDHRRHSTTHNPEARDPAEESGDEDLISPSIPRKIVYHNPTDPYEPGSRKRSCLSDRHSTGTMTSRNNHSAPFELQPPRRSRAHSEPRHRDATNHKTERHHADSARRSDENVGERSGRFGEPAKRNPLQSLADNGAESDDDRGEKREHRHRRERTAAKDHHDRSDRDGRAASDFASSSKKHAAVKNPYAKPPKSAKGTATEAKSKGESSFAYQEVVRGKKERQALPGHECEECKRFLDALGGDYTGEERDVLVQGCSRHRARYAPPSTPPRYWNLTFVDSVSSRQEKEGGSDSP